jgi:hypothetical protein
MSSLDDLGALEREDLVLLIRRLVAENAELRRRIAELERGGNRPAAPFSKNRRKHNPKPSGRKPGEGEFRTRIEPEATLPPVEVTLAPEQQRCTCGGCVVEDGTERVTITEMPKIEPRVRAYDVATGRCQTCGRRWRAKHPQLPPDQTGATAHRVAPEVYATAHTLHYAFGLTTHKVARVLKHLFNIRLTQSAITQNALRTAHGALAPVHGNLIEKVRGAEVLTTDDTSWRINGNTAFLMGFDSDQATVYQIRDQHRHQEVLEVIGPDFAGTLSTDRGPSYDARALSAIPQNKCTAHLLRNIRQAQEGQSPQAQTVGWQLADLVRRANGLWWAFKQQKISREEFDQRARVLKEELSRALNPRRILRIRDPDNRRLLRELAWHHKRGSLLRFLDDPTIEPTNNRAERALRPAVIVRKVSQCSKNHRGAQATAVITSILQTAAKHGMDLLETLRQALNSENPFDAIPAR